MWCTTSCKPSYSDSHEIFLLAPGDEAGIYLGITVSAPWRLKGKISLQFWSEIGQKPVQTRPTLNVGPTSCNIVDFSEHYVWYNIDQCWKMLDWVWICLTISNNIFSLVWTGLTWGLLMYPGHYLFISPPPPPPPVVAKLVIYSINSDLLWYFCRMVCRTT